MYRISWKLEHKIILVKFSGEVTLRELGHYRDDMQDYIEDADKVVYMIFDGHKLKKFPLNLPQVKQQLTGFPPDNYRYRSSGWIVFGMNRVITFMMTRLSEFRRVPIRVVRSEQEAMAYLRAIDDRLSSKANDDSPSSNMGI